MRCRFVSLFTMMLVGCGGGAQQKNPPGPLVEITRDDKPQSIAVAVDNANETDDDKPIAVTSTVESSDKCLVKMRDGRGLPREAMASEAGQQYTEALVHERADRMNEARKAYLMVIQHDPKSRLVPLAYFAFGELFLHEAKSDPMKIAFAQQSYHEVLKVPAPENTAMAFSLFRLGQIFAHSGREQESLNMLSKLMTLIETQPDASCAKSLGDAGRQLIAVSYANVGQPNRAFSFFVHSTGNRPSGKTNALEMLANLCDIYIHIQKPDNAAAALVAVNEDHAGWAFCTREERIMTQISPSIAVPTRDELVRLHAARCAQP